MRLPAALAGWSFWADRVPYRGLATDSAAGSLAANLAGSVAAIRGGWSTCLDPHSSSPAGGERLLALAVS